MPAQRTFDSPLGALLGVENERAVVMLEFAEEGRAEALLRRLPSRPGDGPSEALDRLGEELAEYFAGSLRDFTVPLAPEGSEFEQSVWDRLRRIPYGTTRSYLDIAQELGDPGLVRAVGQANGANPIAVVIPCHRVVRSDGSLGGYGGGLWRKRRLLELEGVLEPDLSLPL